MLATSARDAYVERMSAVLVACAVMAAIGAGLVWPRMPAWTS